MTSTPDPSIANRHIVDVEQVVESYGPGLVRDLADARAGLLEEQPGVDTDDELRFAESWFKKRIATIQGDRLSAGIAKLDFDAETSLRQFVLDTAFQGAQLWRVWNDHPTATNLWVQGNEDVIIEQDDGSVITLPPVAKTSSEIRTAVRSLRSRSSRPDEPWDHTHHALEFVVDDGTRVTAIDQVTAKPFVTFRRPTLLKITLDDLVGNQTMARTTADFLAAAVQAKFRILVAGSMNTGKTVMLRALAAALPKDWITVTAESQAELMLDQFAGELYPQFIVALEARKPGADGSGAVSLNRLIEDAQRMSPKCVIVGEVRGEEAVALSKSVSQGYQVMSTIHGYSSFHAVSTAALYLEQHTNIGPEAALRRMADGIDLVVFMDIVSGKRMVAEVAVIGDAIDGVVKADLVFDHTGQVGPLPERVHAIFDRFGIGYVDSGRVNS